MPLNERFKQMAGFSQLFGFLYSRNALISTYDSEKLSEGCLGF